MSDQIASHLIALRKRNLFPSLSDRAIDLIASEGRLREYERGSAVFREGDAAQHIFMILAGHIAVVHVRDGRQYVLHDEREGGTIGEVPAFSGTPYLATALCRMNTTCITLSIDSARKLVRRDPDYAELVIARLGECIKRLVTRVESASSLSTTQRVARFLIERNSRAPGERFRLGLSQHELAEELGTVRETISRTITQLAESGLIEKHAGGWFTVRNGQELSDIAGV